jgi:hypothetical protein
MKERKLGATENKTSVRLERREDDSVSLLEIFSFASEIIRESK